MLRDHAKSCGFTFIPQRFSLPYLEDKRILTWEETSFHQYLNVILRVKKKNLKNFLFYKLYNEDTMFYYLLPSHI